MSPNLARSRHRVEDRPPAFRLRNRFYRPPPPPTGASAASPERSRTKRKSKDVGSGIQGSSFQQWLAAKECALKRDENKHSGELIGLAGKGSPERHNAGSRDGSRKRSRERLPSQEASPVPRELYFEEEGGPRWVIKYSPSPSVTPGQPAVDGPRLHKSTRSRERTPPVLGTQRPPGGSRDGLVSPVLVRSRRL
ncbi:hypothetical protein MRX96_025169 [Rhipicephalus microplus]